MVGSCGTLSSRTMMVMMMASTPSLNASSLDLFMRGTAPTPSRELHRQRGAPRPPLRARLSPQLDDHVGERRRQTRQPQQARTQAPRDRFGTEVIRGDGMDDLAPAQLVKRPVDGGNRTLGGITASPGVMADSPTHLGAGPALRVPRSE